MLNEAVEQTEKELQANLANKAELLETLEQINKNLEQVNKKIEHGRIILQVLKFAEESTNKPAEVQAESAEK